MNAGSVCEDMIIIECGLENELVKETFASFMDFLYL